MMQHRQSSEEEDSKDMETDINHYQLGMLFWTQKNKKHIQILRLIVLPKTPDEEKWC